MNAGHEGYEATQRESRRGGFAAMKAAVASATQWRLLLLWVVATLLPTWLAVTPLYPALQARFGHSAHAADIATGRDLPLLAQGLVSLAGEMIPITAALSTATIVTLLLAPWLTGMVVASLRARRRLGFGELIHGGLTEYWRMLRMQLWSLVPLGSALGIGAAAIHLAGNATAQAILQSEVVHAMAIALAVAAIVFVVAHASIEAGRGWLGADTGLRSVLRAWWRGLKLLLRRPIATSSVYLGSTIAGFGLALLLSWLRITVDGPGAGAAVASFAVTQAMVAVLAWGRIVRLYGLSGLAA